MAIVMLDHIGIVARNWQEARGVLVDQMGFTVDIEPVADAPVIVLGAGAGAGTG